jgi:hypothetical protein
MDCRLPEPTPIRHKMTHLVPAEKCVLLCLAMYMQIGKRLLQTAILEIPAKDAPDDEVSSQMIDKRAVFVNNPSTMIA